MGRSFAICMLNITQWHWMMIDRLAACLPARYSEEGGRQAREEKGCESSISRSGSLWSDLEYQRWSKSVRGCAHRLAGRNSPEMALE